MKFFLTFIYLLISISGIYKAMINHNIFMQFLCAFGIFFSLIYLLIYYIRIKADNIKL